MQGAFRDQWQAERPRALGGTAAMQYAGGPDDTGQLNLIQQKLRESSLEATAPDLFLFLVPRHWAYRHGIDVVEMAFDDTATRGLYVQRLRRHWGHLCRIRTVYTRLCRIRIGEIPSPTTNGSWGRGLGLFVGN